MFNTLALWRMARPLWSLSFVLGLLTIVSGVALLAYSGWFITAAAVAGVAGSQAGSFNYLRPGAMIRLLAITRTAGRYAERLQSHYTILEVLKHLRLQCFTVLSRNFNPFQTIRSGRFNALQQLIADIDVLDQYPLKLLLPFAWAATALTIAASLLWLVQPQLAILVLISWLVLLVVLPGCQIAFFVQTATADALLQSERREEMLEQMSGLTTMTMLGQSHEFLAKFSKSESLSASHRRKLQLTTSIFAGLQQLVLVAMASSILLMNQNVSAALLIGCCLGVLGLSEVLAPLNQLHTTFGNYKAARIRLEQLTSKPLLTINPVEFEANHTAGLQLSQLVWPFSQVKALSLSAKAGDLILVKGASGCGKSSLFAAIAGELAITSGQIMLRGGNSEVSWLDQHPYIFGLSIAANLRIANPTASDEQLRAVLAMVELTPWLARQQDDLNSNFDQQQLGLSGGELRRFALARCLLRTSPVLLLDEPFAGLPNEQALRILQNIKQFCQQQVCLIISHQYLEPAAFSQIIHLTADSDC